MIRLLKRGARARLSDGDCGAMSGRREGERFVIRVHIHITQLMNLPEFCYPSIVSELAPYLQLF